MKNGTKLKPSVSRFKLGKLTGPLKWTYDQAREYHGKLTKAVIARRGVSSKDDLSETDQKLINTAASAEMYGGILRWILRNKLDTMDAKAIETNSQKQYQARLDRNEYEKQLGIDQEHDADPWGAVDAAGVPDNGADLKDK